MNSRYSTLVRLIVIYLALICATVPASADTLARDIDAILASPALMGAITGVDVRDCKTMATLYSHNADVRLIPASNRKLFTAALAMSTLGPDYTFKTELDGPRVNPDGKTIEGDVTLVGSGDATFTTADAHVMAKSLYDSGVRTIMGHVNGNGGYFTDGPYPDGWGWDTLSDYYAPEITALEIDEGVMNITVSGDALYTSPKVVVDGPAGYVTVTNNANVVPADKPNTLVVYRKLGQSEIVLLGSVPLGSITAKPIVVTISDPAKYAALVMKRVLIDCGITVQDKVIEYDGMPRMVALASHSSVPLSAYLPLMLKPSDNLMAECLIRAVGAQGGKRGSFHNAELVEGPYLKTLGISDNEYDFADASGVSRMNLVTPHAITSLLIDTSTKPWFHVYYDALPIAGVDGTLKHRMEAGPAKGNVHAKTGTVRHNHCLSGYVTTHSGRLIAFSIMNNNFVADVSEINKVQDAIAQRLAAE